MRIRSAIEQLAMTAVVGLVAALATAEYVHGQPASASNVLAKSRMQNRVPPRTIRFRSGQATPIQARLPVEVSPGGHFRIQVTQGQAIGTPAVHGRAILVGDGFGGNRLYCIDAKTLKVAWCHQLSDPGTSAVACDRGIAVVNTESCTVYAIEIASGRPLWSAWLGDPLVSAPTVAGGCVFTSYPVQPYAGTPRGVAHATSKTSTDFVFVCLDLRTGRPLWQRWIDQHVASAPVVSGDHVVATTFAGTLYGFRGCDGKIAMARQIQASTLPVIANNRMFVARRTGHESDVGVGECMAAINLTTGQEVFTVAESYVRHELEEQPGVEQMQRHTGARPLQMGNGLFFSLGDKLYGIHAETGNIQWTIDLPRVEDNEWAQVAAPPVAAGGNLFVGTQQGKILRIDPAEGKVLETYEAGGPILSEPIIVDGYILVGTADGQLVGIHTGNPRFTGWHQYGGNAARTCVPAQLPAEKK